MQTSFKYPETNAKLFYRQLKSWMLRTERSCLVCRLCLEEIHKGGRRQLSRYCWGTQEDIWTCPTTLNCLHSQTWQSQLQVHVATSTHEEHTAGGLNNAATSWIPTWGRDEVGCRAKHIPPENRYTLERAVLLRPNLLPDSGWIFCIFNCKYLYKPEAICYSLCSFVHLWWKPKGKIHLMVNTGLWKIIA